ncbi:MAG: PEP-CTERM sorting domain-containing protein [Thermoguttaceae bacterium]
MLLAGFAVSVQAEPILLSIDVSKPSAVTITATGAHSLVDDSSANVQLGVVLLSFFNKAQEYAWANCTGDLTPPSSSSQGYNWWGPDTVDTAGLNLYAFTGGVYPAPEHAVQNFSTTASAFTGTCTVDLSSYAASLPLAGESGDIWAGSSGLGSHAVLGQWVAVPEPSTMCLLTILFGSIVAWMWRRRG